MNINNENIDYIELISSYLSDELDSSQISILENWVKADSENKKTFLAYKNAWISSNINNFSNNIDVDSEFKKVQAELFKENTAINKNNNSIKLLLKIAAVIAIILGGIISVNFYLSNKTFIYSAENEIIEQTTPDGSVISINRNSVIEYNKSKKARNVKLKGSAFFKVKHNDKVPFIIETQDIKVSVLGTSFLVNSRKTDDFITVIVKTGKVSVKNKNEEIILVAGEEGIFSKKENKLYKSINNDINYLSWKTKKIQFNNTNLKEVVRVLNNTYNKNIIIDKGVDISNNKLTAKFDNKPFESVLNIIKETLDIKITKENDEIIILSK